MRGALIAPIFGRPSEKLLVGDIASVVPNGSCAAMTVQLMGERVSLRARFASTLC